jgi:hypothetical protein
MRRPIYCWTTVRDGRNRTQFPQPRLVAGWEVLKGFAAFRPFRPKGFPLPQDSQQAEKTFVLECIECGARDAAARDWKAFVTVDETLLVYCELCAEREFGD